MSHGHITGAATDTVTSTRTGESRLSHLINTWPGWSALAVGVVAAVLAMVNIKHVSLWIDESYTLSVATRSVSDLWRMVHNIDIVHALYNVMLHPWFSSMGVSEVTVRLPSVVATGLAAAGVVVLTGRLATRSAAVAAGLVFAVLPRVTWMGIEGRSYAATSALAVWLTVLFVGLLRRPTPSKFIIYALLGAVGGSLNIFLVLLLGAHGLTLLFDRRLRFTRAFWMWCAAAIGGGIGALPVLLTAVSQSAQIGPTRLGPLGYVRSVAINQYFLGDTPTIYLSGGGSLGDGPGSQLWKYTAVLLAVTCGLLIAWCVLSRDGAHDGSTPSFRSLFLCWMVVPTAVLVGYSVAATPLYNPRYLTFTTPAVAGLLGIGLIKLGKLPGRLALLRFAAVALIVLLSVPIFASQRTSFAKSGADWKQIATFVSGRRAADQAVYYAPRNPGRTEEAQLTGRTAQVLYPAAFEGLRDLTLVSTPATSADLVGRSRPLAASVGGLEGIGGLFVLRRADYPADVTATENALLLESGFHPRDTWQGPLNTVTEFTR